MSKACFEWDQNKDVVNQEKHGVPFAIAQLAFLDTKRIIAIDLKHSKKEKRYYCIGKINNEIITLRFTYRKKIIRIIGAGYWRKGKALYEKKNKIQ